MHEDRRERIGVTVPPAGRAIRGAVADAVAAVADQDPDALHTAGAQLRAADENQVRDVLHTLTLGLIEQAYPDGVDGDDVRALLTAVIGSAAGWLPDFAPDGVVLVVLGALAYQDPEAPAVASDADTLPVACALTVGYLLGRLGLPLEPELTRTFDALRTAQTMDLP